MTIPSHPEPASRHGQSPSQPEWSITTGGFGPFLGVRGLTVVHDNALRWLAIGLGKRACQPGQAGLVLTIGTAGFVLPFVVLAWLAGYLADRYSKRSVIRWCKAAEILIAAAAGAAIAAGVRSGPTWLGLPTGLWLLLGCVGVIGCQAALMAPSLIGTIPETVPTAKLSQANGLFAMVGLAATLVGMALGNWLADGTVMPGSDEVLHSALPWMHAIPAAAVLLGLAVAGWLASLFLVGHPAAAPDTPPPRDAFGRSLGDLQDLLANRELAAAAAGIIFFWAIAVVAQLNVDQFAAEAGAASQGQVVPLLGALVGGIGAGSLLAGRTPAGRGIDLGLVPVGGAVMAAASVGLAFAPRDIFSPGGAPTFGWWYALVSLAALGMGAGLFDVPLEAYFQTKSPPHRRGAMLSAMNLLVFTGMFVASLLYGLLRTPFWTAEVAGAAAAAPFLSARGIFGLFGLLAATAAVVAVYAAPRASLRWFLSSIVQMCYRFRVRNADWLPSHGPAVVVANHLSWLDGFIVVLASPRPIRMVVYGPNIQGRFLRMLSDQWRFILFDPKPKSIGTALKTIQSGLADGDVIGIFCEGGISRTGQILGFKRGLEWLLERVDAPMVPLHIDGMWGSILSFSEGRYFTKRLRGWRRPLTLTFGRPLPVGTHPDVARLALQELSAGDVRRRLAAEGRRLARGLRDAASGRLETGIDPVACAATAEAFDGCCLVRRTDRFLASLAPEDPLADSLGRFAGPLLGVAATVVDPATDAASLRATIEREGTTIWLARVEQVRAMADGPPAPLDATLAAVVMPIAHSADLAAADEAARRFRESFGVDPVVAYAPDRRTLLAMQTPPSRAASHEVTFKPGTLGRVVNGAVVWPTASMRAAVGLPPPAGVADAEVSGRTLAVAATLPSPDAEETPGGLLLDEDFDVDPDGFLVRRDDVTAGDASGGR